MTNTIEFKVMLMRKGLTIKKLSDLIGISATSISYKMNNVREFKSSEIQAIQNALDLTDEERNKIFFAESVD